MKKLLKVLSVALCVVALVVGSVAATVAYLAMSTATVEHTFTAGNINIRLNDATPVIDEMMMPGVEIAATRAVTVEAGSEKCYLFVKVTEENDFDNYLTYTMYKMDDADEGWTLLEEGTTEAVYYREVEANASEEQTFNVFDHFTARPECTKAQYDAIRADAKPNVTLTAYAVQFVGFADNVAGAWNEAQNIPRN